MKTKSAQFDILVKNKVEIDCCVQEYHCFKSFWEDNDLDGDNLTSLVIDQNARALTNVNGVAAVHVPSFY